MEVKEVIWDKVALTQLEDIFHFLKIKSNNSTNKIIPTLLKLTKELALDFEIYNLDRFKIENDGSYRAFEKYHYRISYRITEDTIRILRIRHTSRNPEKQ